MDARQKLLIKYKLTTYTLYIKLIILILRILMREGCVSYQCGRLTLGSVAQVEWTNYLREPNFYLITFHAILFNSSGKKNLLKSRRFT